MSDTKIFIKIVNNYRVLFEEIELDLIPTTTLQELLDFIKENIKQKFYDLSLPGNTEDWTCYCLQLKQHLTERNQSFGNKLCVINLFINIADNQEPQNILQHFYNCSKHFSRPIEFICMETHICQRKLCSFCIIEQKHKSINQQNILTVSNFIEQLKKSAEQIVIEKKKVQIRKQNILQIFLKLQHLINEQKNIFLNAIMNQESQFNTANELIKHLQNNSILDDPQSLLDEMIYIQSTDFFSKQRNINQQNLNIIDSNLQQFAEFVDQFSKNIKPIKFQYINLYESDGQTKDQQNLQLKNLIPLHRGFKGNEQAKYLIQNENIKIEAYNHFALISSFNLNVKEQITLETIGKITLEKLNLTETNNNISNDLFLWAYHSSNLNKRLVDFKEFLYNFIKTDLIKINVASNQPQPIQKLKNDLVINLTIQITDGIRKVQLQSTFSKDNTIQDLMDIILDYLGLSYSEAWVDISFCNQILYSKTSSSLFQLSIKDGANLGAKVIRLKKSFLPILQSPSTINSKSIVLNLVIVNWRVYLNFKVEFKIHQTLEDVANHLMQCCQISREFATIDLFIFNQPYNQNKRQQTLDSLGIKDDITIEGKIRFFGG